jgi:hypothetical protein
VPITCHIGANDDWAEQPKPEEPDMTAIAITSVPASRIPVAALAVAGPLWAAVSLTQAATREGFDLTRHPLSLLSTGALGWLQIVNFIVGGVLLVVGAAGLRQVMGDRPGSRWAPRLVRVSGIGMVAAGILRMDPADGYPSGTPTGMPPTMSWHSIGHMASGSITFLALIAACYVLTRHFAASGSRGMATCALISGTALVAGDGWAMAGGALGSVTLAAGAITAMCFLAVVAARNLR